MQTRHLASERGVNTLFTFKLKWTLIYMCSGSERCVVHLQRPIVYSCCKSFEMC